MVFSWIGKGRDTWKTRRVFLIREGYFRCYFFWVHGCDSLFRNLIFEDLLFRLKVFEVGAWCDAAGKHARLS